MSRTEGNRKITPATDDSILFSEGRHRFTGNGSHVCFFLFEPGGLADSFGLAFYKAEEAAQQVLPAEGTVLITVNDNDKRGAMEVARAFHKLGFIIEAISGTQKFFADNGVPAEVILKMHEGRPNIVDAIKNGTIQLVINTPGGRLGQHDDSCIRKAAIKWKAPLTLWVG